MNESVERLRAHALAAPVLLLLLLLGSAVATSPARAAQGSGPAPEGLRQALGGASALFAHTASGGSAVRAPDRGGEWILELRDVPRKALAFEDRPGRREEPIPMRRMLGGFFAKPGADPPNASLSFESRGGKRILLGVELLDGRYDRERRTARYRFRPLKQHGKRRVRPPRHFRDTSVFIDTIYNHCSAMVVPGNGVPTSLALLSANKAEHDDWSMGEPWYTLGGSPPQDLSYPSPGETPYLNAVWWGTESGFARGCWNNAGYGDANGSIEVSVSDPYTGSNGYSCTATGDYICEGPYDAAPFWFSNFSGDDVAAIYAICMAGDTGCGYDLGLYDPGTAPAKR